MSAARRNRVESDPMNFSLINLFSVTDPSNLMSCSFEFRIMHCSCVPLGSG